MQLPKYPFQGYDWAFNYKTQDITQTLNIAAPNGVGPSNMVC